jgi:phosphatidylserine decarboxylase
MKIHKEGKEVIIVSFFILFAVDCIIYYLVESNFSILFWALVSLSLFALIVRFFRVPSRSIELKDGVVFAPADGKVVVIEETEESEFLSESRIQISIFMSIFNVHINWYPVGGVVKYFKHHDGRFQAAWLPKASSDNERATTVIETPQGTSILVRQIAGAMARRIVSYSKPGEQVQQDHQLGFIRFGSRVDIFLPLNSEIKVKLGQKVTGSQTVIAKLP